MNTPYTSRPAPARTSLSMFIVLLILTLQVLPARAAVLEIIPSFAVDGSSVNVLIGVTGLGASSPPSLAAFDLVLLYSPRVLTLTSVNFRPYLGETNIDLYTCPLCSVQGGPIFAIPKFPSGTQATTSVLQSGFPGFPTSSPPTSLDLHVAETSMLGIALDGAQPSSFPLVSIDFTPRASGVSELGLFIDEFSDIAGGSIVVSNATDVLGRSFVRGPSVKVPEPPTHFLLVIGVALAWLTRRYANRRQAALTPSGRS